MKALLITIDGPAGAGKTTISQTLACRLGYHYIDTGALYRGVALAVKEAGLVPTDDQGLEKLLPSLDLRFERDGADLVLVLNGRNVSREIRHPEVSMLASAVSARPVVREFLLTLQQELGSRKRMVFEGRDMGTVVFPDADIKIYLDADPLERARRRHAQVEGGESRQSLNQVSRDMQKRDANDRNRDVAPLKPATDAFILDSSELTIEGVVESILAHIRETLPPSH